MSKVLAILVIIFLSLDIQANEVDSLHTDAAKKCGCSISNPCDVRHKCYEDKCNISVHPLSISDAGIINYEHDKRRVFLYEKSGEFIEELNIE